MTQLPLTGSSWGQGDFDIPAYLQRLGVRPAPPSPELLATVHRAHVETLPFTNADILLGTYPGVAPRAVQRQLVERGRGGYCFAHAQLMAAALEHLGFPVRRQLGRVGSPDSARTHMTLVVETGGRQWFADPGYGFSIREPIELRDGAVRDEGGRRFELSEGRDGPVPTWTLLRDGQLQHVSDLLPVRPNDVRTGDAITSQGLSGPFTSLLIVNRWTREGHVSITDTARTVRADDEPTRHEEISVEEAVVAAVELGVELTNPEQQRLRSVLHGLRQRRELS